MDIQNSDFEGKLVSMLQSLSTSHFVALDLEFSGLDSGSSQGPTNRPFSSGKQSIQERYQEVKQAAKKYQILQIGFTVVQEDKVTGTYHTKPYNINLSPLILDETIPIRREILFLSQNTRFLVHDNKLNMHEVFRNGVTYLTKTEEKEALQMRTQRSEIPDLVIDIDDDALRAFMARVRNTVKTWVDTVPRSSERLTLGPESLEISLSALQKRAVHQIVRKEFIGFLTKGMGDSVLVYEYDKVRETKAEAIMLEGFKEILQKQKGIGWFVEAMAGIKPDPPTPLRWFPNTGWTDPLEELRTLCAALKKHSTILVGHNLFADLAFLYQTFFGELPDTVEGFVAAVHRLFPRIVDTKYLATHTSGRAAARRSSLYQLDAEFGVLPRPLLEIDAAHNGYSTGNFSHEAGYDAFLTARLCVRLSALVDSIPAQEKPDEKTVEKTIEKTTEKTAEKTAENDLPVPATSETDNPGKQQNILDEDPVWPSESDEAELTKAHPTMKAEIPVIDSTAASPSHSSTDPDDIPPPLALDDSSTLKYQAGEGDLISLESPIRKLASLAGRVDEKKQEPDTSGVAVSLNGEPVPLNGEPVPLEGEPVPLMPTWDSEFWKVYGNTLRVFGTQEEMLYLGDFVSS